jgi:hypothetical protein
MCKPHLVSNFDLPFLSLPLFAGEPSAASPLFFFLQTGTMAAPPAISSIHYHIAVAFGFVLQGLFTFVFRMDRTLSATQSHLLLNLPPIETRQRCKTAWMFHRFLSPLAALIASPWP